VAAFAPPEQALASSLGGETRWKLQKARCPIPALPRAPSRPRLARDGLRPKEPQAGGGIIRSLIVAAVTLFLIAPALLVVIYRFAPPPINHPDDRRADPGAGPRSPLDADRSDFADHRSSVIASEDARFCAHNGFDVAAIEKAIRHNQARPGKIRGGSTISQQAAKNVFLWPQRSWVRKGPGSLFHRSHRDGVGQAADHGGLSQHHRDGPGDLWGRGGRRTLFRGHGRRPDGRPVGAALAAIIPDPLKWRASKPGPMFAGGRDASSPELARSAGAAWRHACSIEAPLKDGVF